MVNSSNFYRVILYSDRVQPALCQYIFPTISSAKYCVERYLRMYHIEADYQIMPLKIISYEKNT